MASSSGPSRARNLFTWTLAQCGQFAGTLLQFLFVGVALAIWRRRFHWGGFAATLGVMTVGVFGVGAAVAYADLHDWHDPLLWGGVMLAMGTAGFVGAACGKRLGFWESYLASWIVLALVVVQLARGWKHVLGIDGVDSAAYADLLMYLSPGTQLLGPMWDRLVGLAAVGGFLMAVFGGSLGYLVYADGGRRDPGLAMEWHVALRHLSGQRHGPVSITALVAVLGIALGVASLVTVTSVMSGYQQDIQAKILSTNAHLVVRKYGIDFVEYAKVIDEAMTVPGVQAASPFTFNEAMLSTGREGMGVLLKGVVPKTAGGVTGIESNLCERVIDGRCMPYAEGAGKLDTALLTQGAVPSVVIGLALYNRLLKSLPAGKNVADGRALWGERVTLTTPVGVAGARGNAPKRMQFRIGGVFRSGMYEFDARLIYLDLPASQTLLGLGEAVSGVEFRMRDPDAVELTARQVLSAIGRYPYTTLDWRALNSNIFTALKLQKIVMFLVLCFIVVVAAFNIASTLFMAVVEKARDIAVLKSMGARDASIMKIFVLQGWLTGGVGTFLGVLLGLSAAFVLAELQIGIAADVYMVESLQVRVMPTEVILTVLAALGISHLATLYPALKAARQRPVDAMRYD